MLQKTPFSFDVSVWEFFWPLLTGARLVVARPGGHRDPAYLARADREHGVTTLHFVPSMLHVFLERRCERRRARRVLRARDLQRRGAAGRAGRALPRSACRASSCTTSTARPRPPSTSPRWTCAPGTASPSVPIGRPIANTRIYVLDAHLAAGAAWACPASCTSAACRSARGYLNRAELTAERFVPDPFAPTPGARLYRTGDLARWLPDGTIEYLGRIDFQVKIRGFRIELGEIEARLTRAPAACAPRVVARREDGAGDTRLVAYFVAQPVDSAITRRQALRAHLAGSCPST